MREAWDHALEISRDAISAGELSRDPISAGELSRDAISAGELSRDARVWRVVSVRSHLQLRSLRAEAWRSWLASLHDDAAFVRHLSAQRCVLTRSKPPTHSARPARSVPWARATTRSNPSPSPSPNPNRTLNLTLILTLTLALKH